MAQPTSDGAAGASSDDSASTAAAKVFDIAELREHILICLAKSTMRVPSERELYENYSTEPSKQQQFQPEPPQPLKCLSAVQRVNHTFHDTTESSKKLQRLKSYSAATVTRGLYSTPVAWLLQDMLEVEVHHLGTYGSITIGRAHFIFVSELNTSDATRQKSLTQFKKLHEIASWKDAVFCDDSKNRVSFAVEKVVYRKGDRIRSYMDYSNLSHPITLGKLFQCYCDFMERTTKEHEMAESEWDELV